MTNLDTIKARMADREAREAAKQRANIRSSTPARTATPADRDKEAAHAELIAMCGEVSVLDLARRDTGENGIDRGVYVAFDRCPLCGHSDCFRVYPATNTCACFGGSNAARKAGRMAAGGTVIDYLTQRHHGDHTAAVAELRELAGHPYVPRARDAARGGEPDADGYILPRWEHVRATDPPPRKPVLVPGILRRGHVAVLVGKGKVGKSACAMELSAAVATGGEWFGRRIEGGGRVLYLDPEIDSDSAHNRFHKICGVMGADTATVDGRVLKWPLRGTVAGMEQVEHDISLGLASGELPDLALVVVDSASVFIEGDENSSVDMRAFFSHLMRISTVTGASILAVAHAGKAKDGDRDAADRARGSSVWLDAPDALITLSETFPPSGKASDSLGESRYGGVLECGGLREFPRFEPVRYILDCSNDFPVHVPDDDDITDGWKPDSAARRGGKSTADGNRGKSAERAARCESALLAEFVARGGTDGIPAKEAAEVCGGAIGETVNAQTLKTYVESSELLDVEQVSRQRWQVVPRRKPPEPAQRLDL